MHSNKFLLTEILKNKLKFKGMIISDWKSVDRLVISHGSNCRHCIALAINAVIDMVIVPYTFEQLQEDQCRIDTKILYAVKGTVGPETGVVHEQCPPEETLSAHDFCFAIVAVGEDTYAENTETNRELAIQFDGDHVIRSVANKVPTLVIVVSGRPVIIEPYILDKVDAVAAAWLPGTEGNVDADIVFGDHELARRLPVSCKYVDQLPLDSKGNSYNPCSH